MNSHNESVKGLLDEIDNYKSLLNLIECQRDAKISELAEHLINLDSFKNTINNQKFRIATTILKHSGGPKLSKKAIQQLYAIIRHLIATTSELFSLNSLLLSEINDHITIQEMNTDQLNEDIDIVSD